MKTITDYKEKIISLKSAYVKNYMDNGRKYESYEETFGTTHKFVIYDSWQVEQIIFDEETGLLCNYLMSMSTVKQVAERLNNV
jgi:hypothetical protein